MQISFNMGLIDCPGASYSLPWKLAIMSCISFSPSLGPWALLTATRLRLIPESKMSILNGGKGREGDGRYSVEQRERESEIQDATLRWKILQISGGWSSFRRRGKWTPL